MMITNHTFAELERHAYIANNGQAELYAKLVDAEARTLAAPEVLTLIEEAVGSLPTEDFLQDLIAQGYQMSRQRVNKAAVREFCAELEGLQQEIAGQLEYARELLSSARTLIIRVEGAPE